MPKLRSVAFALALAGSSLAREAAALDLPYARITLENGMDVIVQEDTTLPVVAVNLLYRVGSRDEQPGRTGFAHLFEHLMFMGTARAPTKMFDAWMAAAGGSNNAWTSEDFTDYHEVGPRGLLPLFLWLEADRMQALGGEIDAPKLDLQRDVVRNERRQSIENVPYGSVELRLPEIAYPAEHPYHHPVIGSHQDLEAAAVDDVRSFFGRWYVPSNASLVVAGDVKKDEVFALARRYFGPLPGAPRPARATAEATPPPRLGQVVRETVTDSVELPKIVMAFHSPAHFAAGDAELDLLGSVLASGKASRLYKTLVYEKALAQSVSAHQASSGLSSRFEVEVLARPGASLDEIERTVDMLLAEAAEKPPTEKELLRAKSELEYGFVAQLQSLQERARLMNMYLAERGEPNWVKQDLERYRKATAADVAAWAKKTLTLGERVVLRVVPKGAAGKEAP